MTEEDYEKKYKKALATAKDCLKDGTVTRTAIDYIETIFPELKENEDERIRKAIIEFFELQDDNTTYSFIPKKDIIAWLEKQGQESRKVSIWKHWKDGIAGNGEGEPIYLIKVGNTYNLSSCLGFECDYIELSELDNLMLEKQSTPVKLSEEEQNRDAKVVLTSCAMSFIKYLDAHKYESKMCVSNGECEDIENAFHNAMWDRLHRYYCKYIEKQDSSSVKWQKNTPENKPLKNHSVLMKTVDGIAEGEWDGKYWHQYRWSTHIYDSNVLYWIELHDLDGQSSAIRWYDASLIPQEMRELLVEWDSNDATWHEIAFYHADTKTFWNGKRQVENVTRWCYIVDLLEEQDEQKPTSNVRYEVGANGSLIVNEKPFDYEHATITQKDFASVGETATIELSSPIDCGDRIYHVSHKPIEKQGEQKPFDYEHATIIQKDFAPQQEPKFKIGDVLCDKSCTTLDKNSQPNIEILDIRNGMYICNNCTFPIEQQDEYELVTKRVELTQSVTKTSEQDAWSDEDEEMLRSCTGAIWAADYYLYEDKQDMEAWLKSIKGRMQPQIKEWSKEDEEIVLSIEQVIQCASSLNLVPEKLGKIDKWLKRLKDRIGG